MKTEQGVDHGLSPARPGPGRQAAALLGFLALSHGVSYVASLAIVSNAGGWYAAAEKAPWTPPGWAFGSVWMMLYTAMAVAAWLVWRQGSGFLSGRSRGAMTMYGILLCMNLGWAPLFFGMYPMIGTAALWLALLVIAAHAAAAAATVVLFGPISRAAGLLMLPYVSWIVFSCSLNAYAAARN
ncbi:TspO/MBR family protein [Arthrobacter sp. NicSoilB8]|uniref:TspO/MBR family protein n=1 Tax=Arthrobacter sp. NicSoilB8 TaxID=2830998 RepID=UPI001CC4CA13|nr:TspO/MBR family protein [Arthrobacter sp. NicSoilB8]